MNQQRLTRVIENMKRFGLEQLIVSSPDSIFYLLGVKIHPGERLMALYIDESGKAALFLNELFPLDRDLGLPVHFYNDTEDPILALSERIVADKNIGIDKEWPSQFLIRLMKKMPDLKIELGSPAIDYTRMVKDAEEIEKMRKASRVNDKVVAEAIELVKAGLTEIEVSKALAEVYAKYDTPAFSFEPLIAYGSNAAEPHHSSDDTPLANNSCVIIDIGGMTDHYASDMTRSVFKGNPNDEYLTIYDLVKRANEAAIQAVKPGVKLSEIDKVARDIISEAGYGKYFTHRLGHNAGINVHEFPDVSMTSEVVAEPGMVFSIEPGIYLTDQYGVRIEDLVLVTEKGCEVLNQYSKELQMI